MDTLTSKLLGKESWLAYLIVPAISILAGIFLSWTIFAVLRFYNHRKPTLFKNELLKRLKNPLYIFIPLLFLYPVLPYFGLGFFWHKLMEVLIIINFAWILIAFLRCLEEVVKEKFQIVGHQNRAKDRKAITQLRFIKSIVVVVIITLTIASILWNIPAAQELGRTILTSAGILGIIIGVAAQKSIANLITGFQLAFTQPIKIDDEVVIEGEFGNVEDVALTYVVVRTWDWRRLVLPLNYFNEKPFVNWTFKSRELIGSVFFYLDYSFPVNELRTKLFAILNGNPLWDGNIAELLVTDTDNRAMEIRASFSVKNATNAWDLRCFVREELVAFIQTNYPGSLPKLRRMDVNEL
ncbi:MAG: mechanosensitive ion channel domain-containing protein [Saonia sp.]